ncbi:ATP-binding cassette domain-containing protein [Nocardia sp. NBC_01503]|uniref:ABC transporter ATP-binding protein n=1 Tax=Nocardia sp. NBC_01503 TaxID=2975997 RepID=UPI002E7B55F4|nr:ATP-binding cassette domain-containing protein [Nocardia sp. NBC_01503]WTL30417.1 ATP-binding cassette domain-containing protein [Nocardia sp. NBC_01503]
MTDFPVLQVDAVDVVRDANHILQGVSLTVRAGEHWALLGPNGAGKTTLLRMLGAFEHPTRGAVEVLGKRLGRVDMRELRTAIGHVDPRHTPRTPLTVHQVVLTGITNTAEPIPRRHPTADQLAEVDRLIDLLGLAHRHNAPWPILSQGERGRALIARALMPKPRLLLLDEPATGLDLAGREQLLERIDILQRAHPDLSSVLVTHHLEELPPGTTHAMLLRGGRALVSGPVDEVVSTENISAAFDHPVRIIREDRRWSVRAAQPAHHQSSESIQRSRRSPSPAIISGSRKVLASREIP